MSRQELRRRLHEADPNLTIISGRRSPSRKTVMGAAPRVLSPKEAKQWGLPEMIPIIPPDNILVAEARWSKKQLQEMAAQHFLDSHGDKQALTEKLMYIGALDEKGRSTGLSLEAIGRAPYIMSNPKHFCCSLCGDCAPRETLREGRFFDRMAWLRQHYKAAHPGKWGTK